MTLTRRWLLGLAGAALLAAPAAAFSPEGRGAALEAEMRRLVDGNSTPGIVVLILQGGRPVQARAASGRMD